MINQFGIRAFRSALMSNHIRAVGVDVKLYRPIAVDDVNVRKNVYGELVDSNDNVINPSSSYVAPETVAMRYVPTQNNPALEFNAFFEENIPIPVYFEESVSVPEGSYFEIEQSIPGEPVIINRFEIVDIKIFDFTENLFGYRVYAAAPFRRNL